jgi:hypothetical protein
MNETPDPMVAALDRALAKAQSARQAADGEQVLTGAYGTPDYAKIVSCYRRHEKLLYQGTLYHVRWVQKQGATFRAGVKRARKQPV